MSTMTATYSPDDNKLRLYTMTRLDRETYDKVKAAGFKWAPKQELFVAPMWTPAREVLLIELCGEVDDEDTSLVDRAEDRAERFETYSEHRAQDADRAHAAVSAICENIPFGQPILVGHHSEKHARRDAERIENGMRKAVKMWDTAKYWTSRAAGAIANAKYKELPGVRQRRIKGLEADKRKQERTRDDAAKFLKTYNDPEVMTATLRDGRPLLDTLFRTSYESGLSYEETRAYEKGEMTLEAAFKEAKESKNRTINHCNAWINHIDNRLLYERAMLNEQGGTAADKFEFQIGGQVLSRGSWYVISKINRQAGAVSSVSVFGHWSSTISIDRIKDYRPPQEGDTEKVQEATKQAPLCNYETEGCARMTQKEYAAVYADYKRGHTIKATDTHDAHRLRHVDGFIGRKHGGIGKDQWTPIPVFLTDAKVKEAPPLTKDKAPVEIPKPQRADTTPRTVYLAPEPTKFDALKESLKTGVQTVSAPQLFPTPPEIAAKMVEMAEIEPGMTLLEPSGGTGNLVKAILAESIDVHLDCVEINYNLCQILKNYLEPSNVYHGDFLEISAPFCPDSEKGFDRIIMNPPFENGADIKHINHALTMLKPGGKLVALCANGPRQQESFKVVADYWEVLPVGSFQAQGTGVNVALIVLRANLL